MRPGRDANADERRLPAGEGDTKRRDDVADGAKEDAGSASSAKRAHRDDNENPMLGVY